MHEYLRHTLPAGDLTLAVRSWHGFDLHELTPHVATMFGDLVLHGRGGWWFLSTIEGRLDRRWSSWQECEANLSTEDGMQDFLGAGLVDVVRQSGVELADDEVIGFAVPPLLGGGFELDNLRPTKFLVVHLFMSQLHGQVRPGSFRTETSRPPATVA